VPRCRYHQAHPQRRLSTDHDDEYEIRFSTAPRMLPIVLSA